MKKEDHISLYKAMGLPAEFVKQIEDNWDKPEFQIDQAKAIGDFTSAQRTLFEQDPDLNNAIDTKSKARYMSIAERTVKRLFGLTADETKDKSFDEIAELAKTKATANSNKTLETLQNENTTLLQKIEKLEKEEIPTIKSQVENERVQLKMERDFEKWADEIVAEVTAKNPQAMRVPKETAMLTTRVLLGQQFDFKYDENGEFQVLDKKTGLRARTEGGKGNTFLTGKGIVMDTWRSNKFIAESNADDNGGKGGDGKPPVIQKDKHITGDQTDEELAKRFPYLDQAKKHAEALKPKTNA